LVDRTELLAIDKNQPKVSLLKPNSPKGGGGKLRVLIKMAGLPKVVNPMVARPLVLLTICHWTEGKEIEGSIKTDKCLGC
jgi:hypothetical protein